MVYSPHLFPSLYATFDFSPCPLLILCLFLLLSFPFLTFNTIKYETGLYSCVLVTIFLPALFWIYLLFLHGDVLPGTSQIACPVQVLLPFAEVPLRLLILVLRPDNVQHITVLQK